MFPAGASELVAYVMCFNRMNQEEAMKWLDHWIPHWRTEPVPEVDNVIEYTPEREYDDE